MPIGIVPLFLNIYPIIRQMKKNGKRRGIRQRNGGIVRRESWKQEWGFFKKGNMVDGNVVKGYTYKVTGFEFLSKIYKTERF